VQLFDTLVEARPNTSAPDSAALSCAAIDPALEPAGPAQLVACRVHPLARARLSEDQAGSPAERRQYSV
jgi:hypothetical protein